MNEIQCGLASSQSVEYEAAEAELRKVLAGGDSNSEAHRLLGLIYDEASTAEKATQEFLLALQLDPNSRRIQNSLGVHYFLQDRLDLAAEQFGQAPGSAGIRPQRSS
jgi:Flp pilus assembly protein TadD